MADRVDLTCPCCRTRLVVDAATGEVLSEERPKADPARSFDQAVADFRGGAERREEAFTKAVTKTRNLDDLLSKKFEEAKKKASKEKGRPPNPFDLD